VVSDIDPRRPELAGLVDERADAGADHDAGDVVPERGSLREDAEGALQQFVPVVFEEDERAHTRRFSARNWTISSAALPSSSILRLSPRAGGSSSAYTSVFEPASPARSASTPRSPSASVSCGFDLAPMIPLSEG